MSVFCIHCATRTGLTLAAKRPKNGSCSLEPPRLSPKTVTQDCDPGLLSRTVMQWFRTKARAIRLLVALFLLAQFAGVVSSPLAQAHAAAGPAVAHASHHQAGDRHVGGHHADSHRHDGCAHHPDAGRCDHADYCCALHAFFAGILPPAATIDNAGIAGERLRPAVSRVALGVEGGRLDRPPRPLL